jgi:DNA polymerase I-like protein with 3'-5' exonuclease and polymerase domains
MEGAWAMDVPLTVKIQVGQSWGSMEEYLPPPQQ